MTDLIEKIAKEIAGEAWTNPLVPREHYRDKARVALSAIRDNPSLLVRELEWEWIPTGVFGRSLGVKCDYAIEGHPADAFVQLFDRKTGNTTKHLSFEDAIEVANELERPRVLSLLNLGGE